MSRFRIRSAPLALALALSAASAGAVSPDHHEFEAMLEAPYTGLRGDAREFVLRFGYMDATGATAVAWRLELLSPRGEILRTWHGEERLYGAEIDVVVPWDGRGADRRALASGHYSVRLIAAAGEPVAFRAFGGPLAARVAQALAAGDAEVIEQAWDVEVGTPPRPKMPYFAPLPVGAADEKSQAATGSLPYRVYFGNLHSQTNDSDGGGAIPGCSGSQAAQSGAFGPADAFPYARDRGLDFLLTSEHNHYFDGSSSTNTSASPTTAKNRYAAGRTAMATFNSANPNFLALYGMEWGVISNGGHLNIVNANLLAAWEYNSSNQLLGDVFVEKNNYASLYTEMKARGWVGQFNHPSSSDQFKIGTTVFGYTADGDEVMVAAEILNTSAFSTNTTETESGRTAYESQFNLFLERGFHIAPTTNQDNHCANWGASFTNRTGVLLPNGVALTEASFVDALKARRVYASMDKNSQLILTANGHVMGERFANSGPLTLTANFSNTGAPVRVASTVQVYQGVPGRNGTVTLLSSTAVTTITPANGEHFYYAKVTQDDGKILWSAPVWVTQTGGGGGGDTTPPTVSASESGTAGTITLSANASDNVGVTNVEFRVDGALKGADAMSPYSITLDSTTLANGSHSLTATAYDAAGLSTTSSPVSFTISNPTTTRFNEAESNGTIATANVVAPTFNAIRGTMGNTTDKDYFRLSLAANETVKIDMTGPAGTAYDYDLYLVNGSDATLKSSAGATTTETLTYTNGASAQTVYAKVIAYKGSSTTIPYDLVLTYTAAPAQTQLVVNGGFESGTASWTASSGVITSDAGQAARTGTWKAWLNGYGSAHTDTMYQQLTIPSAATSASLSFWLKVSSSETSTTQAFDTLKVQVRNSSGAVLSTLATYSNLNKGTTYVQRTFNVTAYRGQTIRVYFEGIEGSSVATSFVIDDVSLTSQ